MRSGGRTLAAVTAVACCLAACGSETNIIPTRPAITLPTTTVPPTTLPPTTLPPTTLPPTTLPPTTLPPTTLPPTTLPPTTLPPTTLPATTLPPVEPEPPEFSQPIRRVVVVGDSVLFDGRDLPGGRPNEIVPTIARHLAATPGLEEIDVRNAALPGLAVKHAINPNVDQRLDTLADYLPVLLADLIRPGDLVVVAVSSIDVIVTMDDDAGSPSEQLLTEVIDELRRWRDLFATLGVPVVFVPPFGVNDELYDAVKNTFVDEPKRYELSGRLHVLTAALRSSDLFLLVDGFPGLDADGDGSGELSFFVDYDTRAEGWPDDGIHPNRSGELVYGDTVGAALAALLITAL